MNESDLMSRDPLGYSAQNIAEIVAIYRKKRELFIAGDLKAGTPHKKKSATAKRQDAAAKIVGDLGDLL